MNWTICPSFEFTIKYIPVTQDNDLLIPNVLFVSEKEQVNPCTLKQIIVKIADLGSSCWVVSIPALCLTC